MSLLARLHAFGAILCIVLAIGMGIVTVQANASVLTHLAHGDSQASDGGWVCYDVHITDGCAQSDTDQSEHEPDHDNDMLDLHHHHHAEAPSTALATLFTLSAPNLRFSATNLPTRIAILHGIDPSQADQPPKI